MTLRRRTFVSGFLALPAVGRAAPGAGYEWRPWPAGRAAPALTLPALDGGPVSLAHLRGRAVLLNFWASWCEPCREELPSLALLGERRAADGLSVLAINVREGSDAVRRFVQQQALTLPVLLDTDGAAARAFTPRIYPSTVFIGRDGRARGVLVGPIDWLGDEAGRLLAPLLAAAAPTKDRAPAAAR